MGAHRYNLRHDFFVQTKFFVGAILTEFDIAIAKRFCIGMGVVDQFFSVAVWMWYLIICMFVIDAMKDRIRCFPRSYFSQNLIVWAYAAIASAVPFLGTNGYGVTNYNFDCWVRGDFQLIFYVTMIISMLFFIMLACEIFACRKIIAVEMYFASRR